jgi:hypothetical protein
VVAKVLSRILLTRLSKAVDEKLREQKSGFITDRSCTDQITALRIIIEQSLEWYDSALHVVIRVPDDVDELLRYSIMCH